MPHRISNLVSTGIKNPFLKKRGHKDSCGSTSDEDNFHSEIENGRPEVELCAKDEPRSSGVFKHCDTEINQIREYVITSIAKDIAGGCTTACGKHEYSVLDNALAAVPIDTMRLFFDNLVDLVWREHDSLAKIGPHNCKVRCDGTVSLDGECRSYTKEQYLDGDMPSSAMSYHRLLLQGLIKPVKRLRTYPPTESQSENNTREVLHFMYRYNELRAIWKKISDLGYDVPKADLDAFGINMQRDEYKGTTGTEDMKRLLESVDFTTVHDLNVNIDDLFRRKVGCCFQKFMLECLDSVA